MSAHSAGLNAWRAAATACQRASRVPDGTAECQSCGGQGHRNGKGAFVEKATIVGVNLAKNVFQVHGAADGWCCFAKS